MPALLGAAVCGAALPSSAGIVAGKPPDYSPGSSLVRQEGVIFSRSGDKNVRSAHDGNLVTFHRVKNFRDLVY
ncbi:hypothetical protein OPIT5_29185 [Opitutaceae bacterium TAV5]|nr:hypothetical protein OPIT5_29185 [Opitutaceae bacterium TAV5]